MKRKLAAGCLILTLLFSFAGGSLAFFTYSEQTHNIVTTGGVSIEVQEWADPSRETPFTDVSGVLPGMTVQKIAEVKNTGSAPAWVRVRIEKAIALAGGGAGDPALVTLDLNTNAWQEQDGWLYYNRALSPGEVSEPVFTQVTFQKTMGNEYQNAAATVTLFASAVQTANNGASPLAAAGWPDA